jgi:hypothetical protein
MKRIWLLVAVAALSLLGGCFIHEVNQPSEVAAGDHILITLGCRTNYYDDKPKAAVACIKVPYDWTVDSVFWYSPYHMGRGQDELLVGNALWTGYAETRFPSGDEYDWHGYISENDYTIPVADSGDHLSVIYYYVTVGTDTGDFGLCYLVSDTGLADGGVGFPEAYGPGMSETPWWDSTFNVGVTITGVKEEGSSYDLNFYQNAPNPFNTTTAISYTVPTKSSIKLAIYDLLGKEIRVVREGRVSEGNHTEIWDGKDRDGNLVSNGVYFCRLTAGDRVFTKKLAFTR